LSPVQQGSEFHPLDAALNAKTEEEAVEMSFHGSLGDVQVASDFRVVAPLQQEINDLLLPGSHLIHILIHGLNLADVTPSCAKVAIAVPGHL
jgi:hypothetical protein